MISPLTRCRCLLCTGARCSPFPAWRVAAAGAWRRLCPPQWVLGHPWVGDAQLHATPSPWQQAGAGAGLRGGPGGHAHMGLTACSWGHRGTPTSHRGCHPLQPPSSRAWVLHPVSGYHVPRLGAPGHDRGSPRSTQRQPRGDPPSHLGDTQGRRHGSGAAGRETQPALPPAPEPVRHLEGIRQACSPPCKPFVEQIPAVTHCNCCKLYKRRVFHSNGSVQLACAAPTCRGAWPGGAVQSPPRLSFYFLSFSAFSSSGDEEQADRREEPGGCLRRAGSPPGVG